MQTNPKDMYTYDSLHAWKSLLATSSPILASGLSLIIQTALPRGTEFKSESLLNDEVNIHVHLSHLSIKEY